MRAWIDRSETWLLECMTSDAPFEDQVARVTRHLRSALAGASLRPEDWELLATDIDLNAQGVVVAAERRKKK